jgi:hypothetical protein
VQQVRCGLLVLVTGQHYLVEIIDDRRCEPIRAAILLECEHAVNGIKYGAEQEQEPFLAESTSVHALFAGKRYFEGHSELVRVLLDLHVERVSSEEQRMIRPVERTCTTESRTMCSRRTVIPMLMLAFMFMIRNMNGSNPCVRLSLKYYPHA